MTEETTPDIHNQPVTEPTNAMPELTFNDLPYHWKEAMARAGWSDLMPVQAKAIPYLMAGRDLMVQARTGSGKTGAFILPLLERVNPLNNNTQVVIIGPTRELAIQVAKEAEMLVGEKGIRVLSVYGGVSYQKQLDGLKKGAHIVIGTPGRILDHLQRGTMSLKNLQILTFDEADRLLDMGFYPDMRELQSYLPDRKVDTFMFSATFPANVMRLAEQFMHEPDFLSLSSDNVLALDTVHAYYLVPALDKDRALIRIIEVENPASAFIFCNTKQRVNYVTTILKRAGYDADAISSDLSQKDRESTLARVRAGTLSLLVATDVAARGIDVADLSHVIQYEAPEDVESYIHRAGRTGRAGASGVALTLVGVFSEQMRINQIQKEYGIVIEERQLPSQEEASSIVAQRLTANLEMRLRQRDALQKERSPRFMEIAREFASNEASLELLAMLLDDAYQKMLHTTVENPNLTPVKPQKQKQQHGDKRRSGRSRSRRSRK